MYKMLENYNAIIVCPDSFKIKILKDYKDSLIKAKFITIENLIEKLTFSYDNIAIIKVAKEFNLNNDVAKMYINSLLYLNIIENNQKLEILEDIYNYLLNNNLIKFDKLYVDSIRDKDIIIYGYPYIKKEHMFYLSNLNYKFVELNFNNEIPNTIYKFNTFSDELFYTLEQISTLVKNGTDINDIKIICNEDLEIIKRFFLLYSIPLNYKNNLTLSMIEEIKKIDFNNFDINNINIKNIEIKDSLIKIINKFPKDKYDNKIFSDFLKYNLENTKCKDIVYKNAVEIINIKDLYVIDNKHIFILGFSNGQFPSIYKDEEYFKDSEVETYQIDTSLDKNKNAKKELITALKTNNIISLSFHDNHNSEKKYVSSLVNDLFIKIENIEVDKYSVFSDKYNKYIYASLLDLYTKFGSISPSLKSLNSKYDIDYMKYDNKFTGIDIEKYIDNLNGKLNLSYTSIDSYYKCAFQYYISRVLKLDIYEETFPLFLGSLFHEVLKYAFTDDFDFDTIWNNFINNSKYQLVNKELHLLIKLKEELKYIIEIIKDQNNIIGYKNALFEEKVNYHKEVNKNGKIIDVNFVGIIDKLYYKTLEVDGQVVTYVSVVDYKTGNLNIKLDLIDHGLSIQLPIYLYLARKIDKLPNVKVYGFYLQNILHNEFTASNEEEYLRIKKKSLKLNGYTIDQINPLFEFDYTKANSEIIDGLRKKNDGTFYSTSKVLTEEQILEYDNKIDKLIDLSIDNILNANFRINPKIYNFENISCKFCKFSDICYHSFSDNEYIKNGDNNG